MTLYDFESGFEDDMGLLKASSCRDMNRNDMNYEMNNSGLNNDIGNGIGYENGNVKDNEYGNNNFGMRNMGSGNLSLAMAYVPYQEFDNYFTSFADALDNGSLFKDLVMTFNGKRVISR